MMAEITKKNEESTEEILGSIRKIMSEDEATVEPQNGEETEPEPSTESTEEILGSIRKLMSEDEAAVEPQDGGKTEPEPSTESTEEILGSIRNLMSGAEATAESRDSDTVESKPNVEDTEQILSSIRNLMSEDETNSEPDDGGKTELEASKMSDQVIVEELRRLKDGYGDLPEDLVKAVSEVESQMRDDVDGIGSPTAESKEPNRVAELGGENDTKTSAPLTSHIMREFLEKISVDSGLNGFDVDSKGEDLDSVLALLFKISAHRWLEKNLEPLVTKLVQVEIKRLAKNL